MMKITKSTRNTVQVSRMNVFTTSTSQIEMSYEENFALWEASCQRITQEEQNNITHALEEETACRNAQEEHQQRCAENPMEYAQLVNADDDADTHFIAFNAFSAYLAAVTACNNF